MLALAIFDDYQAYTEALMAPLSTIRSLAGTNVLEARG